MFATRDPDVRSEVVFVPGDPGRTSRVGFWGDRVDPSDPSATSLELVLPVANGVRRRRVLARLVPLSDVLDWLVGLPVDDRLVPGASRTLEVWSRAAKAGIGLVARGRLLPAVSEAGRDTWTVGPLEPEDTALLADLAAALPTRGHALPIPGASPLRIRSPDALVLALWDAIADTLARSPAAALAHPDLAAFAGTDVSDVSGLGDWLAALEAPRDAGARPGLRLELPNGGDAPFSAVLQLRSVADPSLVVDAAELWDAPAVVMAHLGDDAETALLLALRRAARVWPPVERLLDQGRPDTVELVDEELADLLLDGAESLGAAGFEVLWPSDLVEGDLRLRASLGTPAPESVAASGMSLDSLLEFRWSVTLDGQTLTADEIDALADAKRPVVRMRGRWVKVDRDLVERLRQPPRPIRAGDALGSALAGTVSVGGETVEAAVVGPLAALADRLRALDGTHERDEPEGLKATLRPYQRRGLAWLKEMCDLGLGACLADDMGLGKTVQVIALHLLLHGRDGGPGDAGSGPTLVVCPASLLGNWQREIRRFAPDVPARRHHGRERSLSDLGSDDVVLTTYALARLDREALAGVPWGLVVADEAQHVKNPMARTARALREIPAPVRLALTGTPVENRLSELWAILDWTTPGLLGPLDSFTQGVAVPIERYGDDEAAARLSTTVRPFLLRRRKTDPGIAPELPPKTETDLAVPFTSEQATLYEAVVRDSLATISEAEGIERRGLVLKLLTGLKQICNHPAQYLGQSGPLAGRSGKLAALDELLDVVTAEGESALVFSQFVQMGSLLADHLGARGIETSFLHGSVPVPRRDDMVARFQAGEVPVLLVSLKAGGTGLNLTRATHVVHYDRWWNPAVEDQATDRAYRIGQDRPVQVHKLLTEGTVEERIAEIIGRKRRLAEAVVGSGEAWISELSDAELTALVTLEDDR